uniref:Uncharacterized protein MANES_01G184100 n=1 Tax=Rhizophora mucronata TaxID=61149 RepID=A0A2P2PDE4_RHIMU
MPHHSYGSLKLNSLYSQQRSHSHPSNHSLKHLPPHHHP